MIVLIIGSGTTILAAYTFFMELPKTNTGITNAAYDVRNIGNMIRNLAYAVSCGDGCGALGVEIINLSSVKNAFLNIATPLYNVASTLESFREVLTLGILTLFGAGVGILFGGVGLAITGSALKEYDKRLIIR